jgi:hypothetical protein
MLFGLANATEIFQHIMNDLLRNLLDYEIIIYIDDILVYSETQEDYDRLVLEVLRRPKKHSVLIIPDKYYWS